MFYHYAKFHDNRPYGRKTDPPFSQNSFYIENIFCSEWNIGFYFHWVRKTRPYFHEPPGEWKYVGCLPYPVKIKSDISRETEKYSIYYMTVKENCLKSFLCWTIWKLSFLKCVRILDLPGRVTKPRPRPLKWRLLFSCRFRG